MTHGILATAFREIAGRKIRINGSVKPFSLHCVAVKTNIMPTAESIMLFYRKAFPVSYQFAGCVLI